MATKKKRNPWPNPAKYATIIGTTPDGARYAALPGYLLPSRANERCHWTEKFRRTKQQREAGQHIAACLRVTLPCEVTLARVAPRMLDDDNLAAAFKAIRDGIAAQLGVDDGPRGPVTWRYEQRKGEAAIVVEVRQ